MAIIDKGFIRGQIRDLVGRKVGGKNVVQAKPEGVIRQTRWTKAAAVDFGTASSASALIRRAFIPIHRRCCDSSVHNRLIHQIQRVMRTATTPYVGSLSLADGNIERLNNFQFNEQCHMHDYLFVDPIMELSDEGLMSIDIPVIYKARGIVRPRGCQFVVLQFQVVGLDLENKTYYTINELEYEVDFADRNSHTSEVHLEVQTATGSYDVILVGLSLLYLSKEGTRYIVHNSADLNPAAIAAAFRG